MHVRSVAYQVDFLEQHPAVALVIVEACGAQLLRCMRLHKMRSRDAFCLFRSSGHCGYYYAWNSTTGLLIIDRPLQVLHLAKQPGCQLDGCMNSEGEDKPAALKPADCVMPAHEQPRRHFTDTPSGALVGHAHKHAV